MATENSKCWCIYWSWFTGKHESTYVYWWLCRYVLDYVSERRDWKIISVAFSRGIKIVPKEPKWKTCRDFWKKSILNLLLCLIVTNQRWSRLTVIKAKKTRFINTNKITLGNTQRKCPNRKYCKPSREKSFVKKYDLSTN